MTAVTQLEGQPVQNRGGQLLQVAQREITQSLSGKGRENTAWLNSVAGCQMPDYFGSVRLGQFPAFSIVR
jgi:hypothetical protein